MDLRTELLPAGPRDGVRIGLRGLEGGGWQTPELGQIGVIRRPEHEQDVIW